MVMADSTPPLRFLLSGTVSAWNPDTRELRIGEHQIWVAPKVPVARLVIGVTGTAVGHEDGDGRRVVTQLTLD